MLLPLLVLWLALSLRLFRLDFQSIWWDEGHSIFVASHNLAEISALPAMDVHPPGYFALLHVWMKMAGSSEFALRYLSVIFSSLTVAVFWRFAQAISQLLSRDTPATNRISPSPNTLESNEGIAFRPPNRTRSHFFLDPRVSAPLLAGLLSALAPLYVTYAQEVRSYAMVTFLALGSTFALWQMTFGPPMPIKMPENLAARQHPDKRWLFLYIILTAACLYTHYFTVFLLLFQNLFWVGWIAYYRFSGSFDQRIPKKSGPVRIVMSKLPTPQRVTVESRSGSSQQHPHPGSVQVQDTMRLGQAGFWVISQVSIIILFLPQLRLAIQQVTTYANPNLKPPALFNFISRSWQAYTVGLTIDPGLALVGMGSIGGVLLVTWFLTGSRRLLARSKASGVHNPVKPGARPQAFVGRRVLSSYIFLLAWFITPLAAYFIVLQRRPSFEPRYMMLATPPLFLLLALSLTHALHIASDIPRNTPYALPAMAYAMLAIPFLVFSISLRSYYTNETYFKDDSDGVAHWLASETSSNDIVYVDVPHPFHYYAGRDNIPATTRYLFVDIHTAADTLNREVAGRDRLYWVTWQGSDTDPRGVIPFLANKAGQPLGQRDFRGYHVEWFKLPQGVHFSLPASLEPVRAIFGDVLRLDGLAYSERIMTNTAPWATLHFTLLRPTDVDYRVSLRLRDKDGTIVAQRDRDLLNDRHFRTSAWPLDDPALNQATNVFTLPLSHEIAPGTYRLEAVVYNAHPPYPSEGVTGLESRDGVAAVLGSTVVTP